MSNVVILEISDVPLSNRKWTDYFHKECFESAGGVEASYKECRRLAYTGDIVYEAKDVKELIDDREGIAPTCIRCDQEIT